MKKIMKRSLPKISGALQFIRYDVLAVSVCHLVVPVVTLVGYDCFAVERGVVHTVDPGHVRFAFLHDVGYHHQG